jgi:hypothetical protein
VVNPDPNPRDRVTAHGHDVTRGTAAAFGVGVAAIGIVLSAYYAWTWRSFSGFTAAIRVCDELFCDFIIYYYPMGEAIFRVELPVDGFLYSPFIAILLALFPPVGLTASLVLWGLLQVASMVLYFVLFRRLVPAGLPIQLLFVGLVFSSFPVLLNLLAGQVSILIVVALLGLLTFHQRGRHGTAAGCLALAVSIKFYPLVFLAPFAGRRDRRFLLSAVGACVMCLLLFPAVLLGGGDTIRFYGALVDAFRDSAWVAANPHSQFLPHVVIRLAEVTGHNAQAHLPILRWIAFGIAAANMALVVLIRRARVRYADLWSFQLVFLTIPFFFKTSWPHDFVFLSFTQAFMAWWLLEGWRSGADERGTGERDQIPTWRESVFRGHTPVMLLLVLASIALSNIVFFNLLGSFYRYGFFGFLFWANLLLLIVSHVELLPPALLGSGGEPQLSRSPAIGHHLR